MLKGAHFETGDCKTFLLKTKNNSLLSRISAKVGFLWEALVFDIGLVEVVNMFKIGSDAAMLNGARIPGRKLGE